MKKVQFHLIGVNQEDLPNDFKKKDYIVGRGFVDDIREELIDCDLLFSVTPKAFGFRSRLCEALSLGVCILTSNVYKVSIPFLKNGYDCYIVDNLNKTGVKILEIMRNPENIKIIKKNARKSYEENLSYNAAGKKFEKLIFGE